MRRGAQAILLALIGALVLGISGAAADEPTYPPYDGVMSFRTIKDASGPEEFAWEIDLGPGQELVQIDDQHAIVFYESGHYAFQIDAAPAHDAEGAAVPTSIAVSEGKIITLTVHHRAGNPAAGGGPFTYPISQGVGWDGGFVTYPIAGPPPYVWRTPSLEAPLPAAEPLSPPTARARCIVPNLLARSPKADRVRLHRANCRLGKVGGTHSRSAKVTSQSAAPGTSLPAWARVHVKLG